MELVPEPVTPDRPDFSIRDLDDAHLEQAVRLWESGTAGERLAFSLADVLAAIAARQPALVALLGEEVVGAIAARVGAPLVGFRGAPPARPRRGAAPRSGTAAARSRRA